MEIHEIEALVRALTVKPFPRTMVVPGKITAKREVHGLALDAAGSAFQRFTPLFSCEREIAGGRSKWIDAGIAYVAVSLVSFDNALKLGYERAP